MTEKTAAVQAVRQERRFSRVGKILWDRYNRTYNKYSVALECLSMCPDNPGIQLFAENLKKNYNLSANMWHGFLDNGEVPEFLKELGYTDVDGSYS